MSELLAPGGSFASACRAFENGADAVYFGLPEFSARKGAVNLSLDELRRLRAAWPEGSLYLALNTLVGQSHLFRAAGVLFDAVDAGIDALIVQDPGIARMAAALIPGLPLHASTQMAVYDIAGASELADAGFSRVVLARECSLAEITGIRNALPDLELEVFIHGALCYGFSGLCQASQVLLDRSANRGACGQICRTWFTDQGTPLYPFSLNDLAVGEGVSDLVRLGVNSLKIEGRMKSPEYTASVCAWYRAILDGDAEGPVLEALAEDATLRFSRDQTVGWLPGGKGRKMVNPQYPGATGLEAGTVLQRDRDGVRLKAATDLENRDGLLWFLPGRLPRPMKAGLRFRDRSRKRLPAGANAWIDLKNPPDKDSVLRLLSRSSARLPEVNSQSYPEAKTAISFRFEVRGAELKLSATLRDFSFHQTLVSEAEAARNPGHFVPALQKAFGSSGESMFLCDPVTVVLSETEVEPFIPPRELKMLRRCFLSEFEKAYRLWTERRIRNVLVDQDQDQDLMTQPDAGRGFVGQFSPTSHTAPQVFARGLESRELPRYRSDLCSPDWDPLPFPLKPGRPGVLPVIGGCRYLPLPPVDFLSSGENRDSAEREIESLLDDSTALVLGLNNPGHLRLARELARRHPDRIESGSLGFFLDFGLNVVNREAWEYYRNRVSNLLFFVRSSEALADDWPGAGSGLPYLNPGPDLAVPLFISRTCPVRHAGADGNGDPGRCPTDCPGNRDFHLQQNRRTYRVFIQDCITWVLESARD